MSVSACGGTAYKGPITDHFDGTRFHGPEPMPDKSWLDVLKWRFTSDRAKWPEHVALERHDIPPVHIDGDTVRVSFVNHATFLVQTSGLNIVTDPIWSERASPVSWAGPKRVHAPGIALHALPKIDIVTVSHSHYDHLDIATLKMLVARDNPIIIVPLGVDLIIVKHIPSARVHALDWGQSDRHENIVMHAEPTYHWSARSPWDRNKTLWASFIYETPHKKLYFSGDKGYASGAVFRAIGEKYKSIDFAMIGIGAYEPRWFMKYSHINPAEAARIFQDIGARKAVPMHFGTFQLSDESYNAPVNDLAAALQDNAISPEDFKTLKPGQFWLLD